MFVDDLDLVSEAVFLHDAAGCLRHRLEDLQKTNYYEYLLTITKKLIVERRAGISFNFIKTVRMCLSVNIPSHRYLHSIAEVRTSSERHHGEQTSSCADVQDDDLFTSSLDPCHSRTDALIIFLILEERETHVR